VIARALRRPALTTIAAGVCLLSACAHRRPMTVGVAFETRWRFGGHVLVDDDRAVVVRATFDTLRRAYDGFGVVFAESSTGPRHITVEDDPDRTNPVDRVSAGAAGVTYPMSLASSVRIDALYRAEMAAAGCDSLDRCAKTRAELLEGLGHGVGATAAHELGHQVGLEFSMHAPCDDCYDGPSATSAAHFFAPMHWSPGAAAVMRRVLTPK
jgi:hypothetical protein